MTRNLKKLLVLVLVLAMAGSMMIVAWADTPTPPTRSDADIEFIGAWTDGIVPPEGPGPDPDDPGDGAELPNEPPPPGPPVTTDPPVLNPDPDDLATMGLEFWTHDIPAIRNFLSQPANTEIDFHSLRIRNNGDWDTNRVATLPTPPYESLAGLWVRANAFDGVGDYDWRVQVAITGFTGDVLEGFELTLIPNGPVIVGVGNYLDPNFSVTNVNPGPDATTPGTPVNIMTGNTDFVGGRNFEGRLRVPQTADFDGGRATANMYWTFISAAP